MNYIKKTKEATEKIIKKVEKGINNNINSVRGKIYKAQVEAENKASGLSIKDIKHELQFNLYSNELGKFLISFCEYIMYILAFCGIITFLYGQSTDYKVVNLSLQLGLIQIFIASVIGGICYIKNKPLPILVYTVITAITYFLRLTDRSYYNIINVFVSVCMSIGAVCIIKSIIKSKGLKGITGIFNGLFSADDEYSEKISRTEIMIRCPKCGKICSKDDNYCVHCGEMIRLQRRVERNSKKKTTEKASSKLKKLSKKAMNAKNNKTTVMKDIEKKIINNTQD